MKILPFVSSNYAFVFGCGILCATGYVFPIIEVFRFAKIIKYNLPNINWLRMNTFANLSLFSICTLKRNDVANGQPALYFRTGRFGVAGRYCFRANRPDTMPTRYDAKTRQDTGCILRHCPPVAGGNQSAQPPAGLEQEQEQSVQALAVRFALPVAVSCVCASHAYCQTHPDFNENDANSFGMNPDEFTSSRIWAFTLRCL